MRLLVFLLRLVLFAVFTLAFVVLYEHGPKNFSNNVINEVQNLVNGVGLTSNTVPLHTP